MPEAVEDSTVSLSPVEIADQLSEAVGSFECGEPVTHVYNPLEIGRAHV